MQNLIDMDILIAHPMKHHVYHLAAGCERSGLNVKLLVPLYKQGLAKWIAKIPGKIGRKIDGYNYCALKPHAVISPALWQVRRLATSNNNIGRFQSYFDNYVASLIRTKKLRPRVLLTMQDYMPETVNAARDVGGIVIWSDQILNRSDDARKRIDAHLKSMDQTYVDPHNESTNDHILGVSDIVTFPSLYTQDGLKSRVSSQAKLFRIPYGVDQNQFSGQGRSEDGAIRILARANTVRKGGHLLLQAISIAGERLVELADNRTVQVVIIGRMEQRLENIMRGMSLPARLSVTNAIVPHLDMPKLLASSDLFVMPSLSEGMSLICVEAMLMKLPAVISPFCGVDCFENMQMGIVVQDTASSLSDGLCKAMENMGNWSKWGSAAHSAATGLSWTTYERKIELLVREIL